MKRNTIFQLVIIPSKIFLHIAFVLTYFISFAQKDSASRNTITSYPQNPDTIGHRFSFDANFGVAMPMEDYGNTSANPFPAYDTTHVNGLAEAGFHFNVTASYLFSHFFGITAMGGGNINEFDQQDWEAIRNRQVQGIITSVKGNYYIGQYMIGPYATIRISNMASAQLKIMVGLATANYPVLTQVTPAYTYYSPPNYYYVPAETAVINVKNSIDFCYYAGISMKSMITKQLGFILNAGYSGSNIGYPGGTETFSQTGFPTYTTPHPSTRYMLLGIAQMTAGLSYDL
ncbi:MAG: hypothetical protein ACLQQ4_00030 [Bacteroidia bacterium]